MLLKVVRGDDRAVAPLVNSLVLMNDVQVMPFAGELKAVGLSCFFRATVTLTKDVQRVAGVTPMVLEPTIRNYLFFVSFITHRASLECS